MAEKSYKQTFNGYWRYPNRGSIPNSSGIYCAYAGKYNKEEKTVTLKRLLYIGQAENIRDRLQNHECYDDWVARLTAGEIIIFSCTILEKSELDRFEAAMIYKHKPPVNDLCVNHFNYDKTNIKLTGNTALLHTDFTVYNTY